MDAYQVIKNVQLTEKGTAMQEKHNKYQFVVHPDANKLQIRQAVQQLFKVTVLRVNTMNCLGKMKRERTMKYGKQADWKRAIVTLKAGDKIELV